MRQCILSEKKRVSETGFLVRLSTRNKNRTKARVKTPREMFYKRLNELAPFTEKWLVGELRWGMAAEQLKVMASASHQAFAVGSRVNWELQPPFDIPNSRTDFVVRINLLGQG